MTLKTGNREPKERQHGGAAGGTRGGRPKRGCRLKAGDFARAEGAILTAHKPDAVMAYAGLPGRSGFEAADYKYSRPVAADSAN